MSDLTAEERKNVQAAIRFLRVRCGGWVPLAKVMRMGSSTLKRAVTPTTAFRVARFAEVGVDDVLAGRYPPAGVCPHCGQTNQSERPSR